MMIRQYGNTAIRQYDNTKTHLLPVGHIVEPWVESSLWLDDAADAVVGSVVGIEVDRRPRSFEASETSLAKW